MNKEKLKQAFSKIKQDILNLGHEIQLLKLDFYDLKQDISLLNQNLANLTQKTSKNNLSTNNQENQTLRHINSTHFDNSTDTSTHFWGLESQKSQIPKISTRNKGVSTDRQTLRQTDKTTQISKKFPKKQKNTRKTTQKISDIIKKLDNIKQETKQKFKSLTQQEFLIFSTIYSIEQETNKPVDYLQIAEKLGLSQSSIRDYVQRLIKKQIPIEKTKISNKKILLKIAPDLTKIANLSTLIQIREQN